MPTFAGYFSSSPEDRLDPTPYINSEQTRKYTERLQAKSVQVEEQPLRYLRARSVVEQALSLVDRAREEGADWDDEEGQPVYLSTAKRAKDLLIDAASRAEGGSKAWVNPVVSATPEGGVHFSWLISGNRVTLTVFAPHRDTVCVSKFQGAASQRELLSDYGATRRVLQAFETLDVTPASANFR